MRKLEKQARQAPSKKPKEKQPDTMRAPRIPFEPVPLHIPALPPENHRRRDEQSIAEPRGVMIIDYGSD